VTDKIKITRALLSVYDKAGIADLAKMLAKHNVEMISTGGTASYLQEQGFRITHVSDLTGFPEILGGRVKTLNPKIFGGILAKRDKSDHLHELQQQQIPLIDMVVVNLYPFEKTIAKPGVQLAEALENIDIGGPCMIRAAAKNFSSVVVLTDPSQYTEILQELSENDGSVSLATRRKLALSAFRRTQAYDFAIQNYLAGDQQGMADVISFNLDKIQELRYGENPHQKAAFYTESGRSGQQVFGKQLHGKELSFNNILDIHAAVGLVYEFAELCCVILKHNNPCGAAIGSSVVDAFEKALATDPVAAYGGIVAFNKQVTAEVAEKLAAMFLEVVVAPEFSPSSLEILTKKKNLRLIEYPESLIKRDVFDCKRVYGGYLMQEMDNMTMPDDCCKVMTRRQPTESEWTAMKFGWKVAKWVKSNAVIFVGPDRTLGIGAGQMSRVDSSRLAVQKAADAGLSLQGSAVISDAYFPFRDGVDAAAQAGATAVIQPGGSVRDNEVIDAANEHNMAMVFTGIRHFRH
jgi:phosphoribosylaminoimidazolecarboxamide formyltransferase / IMP cyclohydrolase